MKKFLLPSLALVLVVAVLLGVNTFRNGRLKEPVTITIPAGVGLSAIAQVCSPVVNPTAFRLYVMAKGKTDQLRPGTYTVDPKTGYADLLELLLSGVPDQVQRFTIPEGYELREIRALLSEAGILSEEDFNRGVISFKKDEYPFLKDIPKGENRLEGFLFPDTYEVFEGESAESILRRMLDRFSQVYTPELQARAKELKMSDFEVVTLASVIEREAAKSSEQAHVSSVFHNRLKSQEYPYLESCATVQYILEKRKPVLSVADTQIDSPYNTYKNPGLPVGPIAAPGEGAIRAALYPENTDDYFFFARPDGTHVFSKTFAQHQAAQQ